MIVIVASRYDDSARRLSERSTDPRVCLLTAEDLSVRGWRYYVGDPLSTTVILGGRAVKQSEIRGVFTRLPWVGENELPDIVAEDRAYVAVEMSAFLLCWLSGLTCPVVNRPSPGCLTGPGWSQEQWIAFAAKAGMQVQSIRRHISLDSSADPPREGQEKCPSPLALTVVGEHCLGEADEVLLAKARHLAALAKVDLLGVQFSGPGAEASFVGATNVPDIEVDGVGDAVLNHLSHVRAT